jgi:hypothetical protein
MRKSKVETPSLGRGAEWTPKVSPSPWRDHIGAGAAFPVHRSIEERALRWHDSSVNARRISHGARKAPKAPR